MVAIINTGYFVRRTLNYNENKVKEGTAQCIGEGNYLVDVDQLSFTMKLNRFLKQLELNEDIIRNSVHISLNFAPSETGLTKEELVMIADRYMQKIGFGEQPYLVYQHHDAGHPHLHVVSINVRADGSRINMFHMGIKHSVNACREVEQEFGLVSAAGPKKQQDAKLKPISMGQISYGQHPSKKAIATILDGILEHYAYTNLTELNALLRQYNVFADPGSKRSRIFKTGGLVYRILNNQGAPLGVCTKASDFHNKPTLRFLKEQFRKNEVKRMPFKSRIQNIINTSLMEPTISLEALISQLEKQGIHVAIHRNGAGFIRSFTYVDHQTKSVFSEGTLGKQYCAEAIQERCLSQGILDSRLCSQPNQNHLEMEFLPQHPAPHCGNERKTAFPSQRNENLLEVLLLQEPAAEGIPHALKKKRKRRKRKNRATHF